MDEIHVKEDLLYDKHEGTITGFLNLGDTHNQLLQFGAALHSDAPQQQLLSKSMLVLMLRGLF